VVEETATICSELGKELLAAPNRPEDTETVPVRSAGEVLVREGAIQRQTQIGGSQS
jgi:hypothetical protein